jgi:hypothetical protein
MGKNKIILTEDSVIAMGDISVGDFRKYFEQTFGNNFTDNIKDMNFQEWLNTQAGKTLKEGVKEYINPSGNKTINELLNEKRFDYISKENKLFIIEFTKQMNSINYDFDGSIGDGYCWGHNMIIYSQKKKIIARIFIRNKGVRTWGGNEHKWNNSIVLRLFFTNIEKHLNYVENAPAHIKVAFIDEHGICKNCRGKDCRSIKTYTIGNKKMVKCTGVVFEYHNPKKAYITDYIDILKEFYQRKLSKK